MPKPIDTGQRYMPGLDGVRAIAVLAVLAYHLGFGWAGGGLLGVGVFFTLSGYLITDLLLSQYERVGRIDLKQFWLRRARRLLPAVLVLLAVVSAWITLFKRSELDHLRGSVLSALTYVTNWWLISQHVSYFARFGPPAPLSHLWSLAVEEQFYLIWPWLVLGGLWLVSRHRGFRAMRGHLALATLLLAAASALEMALLYHPGFDTTRIYDGTDTRAFGLLAGAALAFIWPSQRLRRAVAPSAAAALDVTGVLALVAILALMHDTDQYSAFLYRGGLVLLSLATVVLLACVVHPASRLSRLLGLSPLRWLGVRSYGIYLWHFPIITLTNPSHATAVSLPRAAAQTAATLLVAALSWKYVEDPIRRGALRRLFGADHRVAWRRLTRGWRAAAVVLGVAVLTTSCVGMSQTAPQASGVKASQRPVSIDITAAPGTPSSAIHSPTGRRGVRPPSATPSSPGHPSSSPPAGAATTSCRSVVHIGDSTSEGLVSADYLPDPALRIDAQYADVGVRTQHLEISGGTSILETVDPGEQNAYQVAQGLLNGGYHGCWVLALGTNDTADVVVGSAEDRATRIEKMMDLIPANQPVLWLTVKSLVSSGPYSEHNMQLWNQALLSACAKHPNMRIYDWASAVQNSWFTADGIHFTSTGYAQRAHLIAQALVHAEPATGSAAPGCVVH